MMYRLNALVVTACLTALIAAVPASAKDVSDATGGKLQIQLHAGASLFKGPEIKRAVATGQAQTGEILISILENENPIYGIDVVPFLATSFPEAMKLWKASRPAIE